MQDGADTLLLQSVERFDDGFQVLAILSIGCLASYCGPVQTEGLAGASDPYRTITTNRLQRAVHAGKTVLCGGDFHVASLDLMA
ncbi:hypothetical protein D3C81_2230510 [compost metagenome]